MVAHPEDHRKLWLESIVKEKGYTKGVELGVHEGVTFRHMQETCPDLTWYGVDLWTHRPVFERWYHVLKSEFNELLYRESTFTAHNHFEDQSLDIVFIDADHSYSSVKKDIQNWLPKIKPGGIISGHDINQSYTLQAVVETIGSSYNKGPDLIWYKEV